MTSRRVFIKSASALSAAVFVKGPLDCICRCTCDRTSIIYRSGCYGQGSAWRPLHKVAQIGYNSVENATYTGYGKILWNGCRNL